MELNTVIQGNSLEKLKLLPDNSVDCCITSPPYYGLRDYGTATWEGGDPQCDHKTKRMKPGTDNNRNSNLQGSKQNQAEANVQEREICGKCGARRIDDQVGIEQTPQQYVEKLVAIFEEVRRILKPHGTLWLNLGDSYCGSTTGSETSASTLQGGKRTQIEGGKRPNKQGEGLKPKDLIGIPWMVAFALRDAGWYLRSSIIWYKRNPMPESVRDRPTKAHEDIFLFSKSRKYYYDAEAIRTQPTESTIARMSQQLENQKGSSRAVGKTNGTMKAVGPGRNPRPLVDHKGGQQGSTKGIPALPDRDGSGRPLAEMTNAEQQINGANKKSVWIEGDPAATWKWMFTNFPEDMVQPMYDQWLADNGYKEDVFDVTTKPFKEAHFATFPEGLAVDMVKAGTSDHGCCADCGKPYVRITEPVLQVEHKTESTSNTLYSGRSTGERIANIRQAAREAGVEYTGERKTIGWQSTCKCEAAVVPAVVLDPFDGAGTTRLVARKLNRNTIGIELNPKYIKIGDRRLYNYFGAFL